ncbi:biliverdin-producing heme oxygenase [Undibacterium sp.]|uniref:biliverdin-producing heme oxygenase n=1 Tax=Undibacterium sp. TaxID=1914977 RepID=UPI0037539DC8
MQTTSLRSILKSATASEHAALEALPCQQRLLAADCQIIDYARVLHGYGRAIAAVDQELFHLTWPESCPYLPRLPLLNQDLLSLYPGAAKVSSHLSSHALLHPWGIRYVIEGMSLGAQWMLAKAAIFRNPLAREASSFFQFQPTPWPRFCDDLEKLGTSGEVVAEVTAAANWMFQKFRHELSAESAGLSPKLLAS